MGEAKRKRSLDQNQDAFGSHPEFYSAVGLAVLQWGQLETLMMLGIVRRKGIELGHGLPLAANVPFSGILALWKVEAGSERDGAQIKPLVARIEAAYVKRNALSHGIWRDSPEDGEVIRVHLRADGTNVAELHEKVKVSSITDLVAEIEALRKELSQILSSTGETP
jgi:hypothetical protein